MSHNVSYTPLHKNQNLLYISLNLLFLLISSIKMERKDSETLNLTLASEKSLAKEWSSKEDEVWDKYY